MISFTDKAELWVEPCANYLLMTYQCVYICTYVQHAFKADLGPFLCGKWKTLNLLEDSLCPS
jgi:hypothetical protein